MQTFKMADGQVHHVFGRIGKAQVHGGSVLVGVNKAPAEGVATGGAMQEFECSGVGASVCGGGAGDVDGVAFGAINPKGARFGANGAITGGGLGGVGGVAPFGCAAMAVAGEHGVGLLFGEGTRD